MNIKITADSTCDLSPELIERYHITVFPLHVTMNGESYRDGVDITPDQIFENTDKGGGLSMTSAIGIEEYRQLFEPLSAEYDAVIHVDISSEFSACYQDACNAAQEFDNVYVIDSRNLSTGHGHVVIEAARMAEAGMEPAEILEKIKNITDRVEASFVLDRLDYMRKGGRCSAVAALGANMLQLKPCIEVKDGRMSVAKKYQGSFDKCLRRYIKDRLEGRDDILPDRVFITYSRVSDETAAMVREEVQKYASFNEIIETRAGCTISCHCGPNTLGILFLRK